ncbi:Homeobox protein cut-like 2 [Aix galericulata]|nr:Homeobox protein cut-like 2 [Aix galericulata]
MKARRCAASPAHVGRRRAAGLGSFAVVSLYCYDFKAPEAKFWSGMLKRAPKFLLCIKHSDGKNLPLSTQSLAQQSRSLLQLHLSPPFSISPQVIALSKRSKEAETAFLSVYKQLIEGPASCPERSQHRGPGHGTRPRPRPRPRGGWQRRLHRNRGAPARGAAPGTIRAAPPAFGGWSPPRGTSNSLGRGKLRCRACLGRACARASWCQEPSPLLPWPLLAPRGQPRGLGCSEHRVSPAQGPPLQPQLRGWRASNRRRCAEGLLQGH